MSLPRVTALAALSLAANAQQRKYRYTSGIGSGRGEIRISRAKRRAFVSPKRASSPHAPSRSQHPPFRVPQPSRRTWRGRASRASSRSTSSLTRTARTPTARRFQRALTSPPRASCRRTRATPSRSRRQCRAGTCACSSRVSPPGRSTTTCVGQKICASRGARSSPLRTTAARPAPADPPTLFLLTLDSSTPSRSSASRRRPTTASLTQSSTPGTYAAGARSPQNAHPQNASRANGCLRSHHPLLLPPQRLCVRLRQRRRHGRRRLHAPAATRHRANALHGHPWQ